MNFIEELKSRGLLQNTTEGVAELFADPKQIVRGYIGFDPTAPSLGIGNFVQIATLRRFQQAGHQPIVLLGGATGRIGDPSGKDQERQLLDLNVLEQNIQKQKKQFEKYLDFNPNTPNHAIFVNNADFYQNMGILDFLRDVGKYATVNYMLAKDSVKNRIDKEEGISFTEFSYQLIQGYDFECLFKTQNCLLQMGGSDQWGNMLTGLEFIRKKGLAGKANALSTVLLTKKDGKKFGKSESGNLFLDASLTSPYKLYQYWIGSEIADEDLPKLFRALSFRSLAEIEELEKTQDAITLRRLFAEELVSFVHSPEVLEQVQKATEVVHHPKLSYEFLQTLAPVIWESVGEEVGHFQVSKAELETGVDMLQLFVAKTSLYPSNAETRKAIQGNAIAINTKKITDFKHVLQASDFIHGRFCLLQTGKKNKYVLELV
jgi:tyrosyl-tRNA synthetase